MTVPAQPPVQPPIKPSRVELALIKRAANTHTDWRVVGEAAKYLPFGSKTESPDIQLAAAWLQTVRSLPAFREQLARLNPSHEVLVVTGRRDKLVGAGAAVAAQHEDQFYLWLATMFLAGSPSGGTKLVCEIAEAGWRIVVPSILLEVKTRRGVINEPMSWTCHRFNRTVSATTPGETALELVRRRRRSDYKDLLYYRRTTFDGYREEYTAELLADAARNDAKRRRAAFRKKLAQMVKK